jgi:uncharacterized protein (TIGR03084 family)
MDTSWVRDLLAVDLAAENAALDELLGTVDWDLPTPAEGWTVRDSVVHLHLSDLAALAALRGEDLTPCAVAIVGNVCPAGDLVAAWRAGREAVVEQTLAWDGGKIPWFGPPMSPASFLTARLMETWAHGVDIRDAAGRATTWTPRLRHVADLGFRTRGWSYVVRGLQPPAAAIRRELDSPDGPLTWGDGDQLVRGDALDWCLLVTQRRPRASLSLVAEGPDAERWLEIAQAFAGGPTDGRS